MTTLNISQSCFWHYMAQCDKPDCKYCPSYRNVHEVLKRKIERDEPESSLADKLLMREPYQGQDD